jgi:predicted DNA-binding transcriptional regulator YafY
MLKRLEKRLRELLPAEFRKMEREAVTVTSTLRVGFRENFERGLVSIDGLMAHPDYWNPVWRRQLYRMSHDLRGLGGTFGYGLITTIGEALCDLMDNPDLPDDRFLQRRVVAHVAALNAVHRFDLKGYGGSEGDRLLATLEIAKRKQPSH